MKKFIYVLVFLISVFLVIKGNTILGSVTKNYIGIGMMLIGLSGILTELYLYNKKYQ